MGRNIQKTRLSSVPAASSQQFGELDGWDLIEVSLEDTARLACNGLILDQETYLYAEEHDWLAEELTKYGQKVVAVRYDVVSRWGGSFRCSHHPLVRESELD